ncbi:MAG TPA: hypothetical protein VFU47_13675 [Armatimonadota bacterium]|nr:hypothetical protein [Armatimonadota bacterium]
MSDEQRVPNIDALIPGAGGHGETIPGDPEEGGPPTGEGSSRGTVDQEALMDRLEEGVNAPGSGNLGHGVHVGTPAGGLTEAARTGSSHWGEPREAEEEEEETRRR